MSNVTTTPYGVQRTHEAKLLKHRGLFIPIYLGLVEIIELTWELGIETLLSCENQAPYDGPIETPGSWATIKFSCDNARRWMRIVLGRVFYDGLTDSCWQRGWRLATAPHPYIDIGIFVYFPHHDKPYVVQRLKERLAQVPTPP